MPETLEGADGKLCRAVHHALIADKELPQTKEEAERKNPNWAQAGEALARGARP